MIELIDDRSADDWNYNIGDKALKIDEKHIILDKIETFTEPEVYGRNKDLFCFYVKMSSGGAFTVLGNEEKTFRIYNELLKIFYAPEKNGTS